MAQVHVALLGATICRKMAQVIPQGQAEAEERAMRMQEWAYGALEVAPDERNAHDVLERSIRDDRHFTALDIALRTGAKKFLFQRHCVSLIDRMWRGDVDGSKVALPQDFLWLQLTLYALVPFANKNLFKRQSQGGKGDPLGEKKDMYGSSVFYDALGMAFSISAQEKRSLNSAATAPRPDNPGGEVRVIKEEAADLGHKHTNRFDKILKEAANMHLNDPHLIILGDTNVVSRLIAFYQIPAVKFLLRALTQLSHATLYVIIVFGFTDPAGLARSDLECSTDAAARRAERAANQTAEAMAGGDEYECDPFHALPLLYKVQAWEVLWLGLEVGSWFDLAHQSMTRARLDMRGKQGLERAQGISDILFVVALAYRLAMEYEYYSDYPRDEQVEKVANIIDYYQSYQVLISIKALLVVGIGCMPFVSEYRPLGVLFIMVSEMSSDLATWMLLFGTFTISFMVSFAGLQRAGLYSNDLPIADSDNWTIDEAAENFQIVAAAGAFWSPLWSLFGEFDPTRYTWLTSGMMWFYCLIGSVVLVNLLVAMFADTFTRVKQEAEMEYVFLRCTRLFEYKHVILSTPPLLNLPIVVVELFSGLCSRMRNHWLSDALCRCVRGQGGGAAAHGDGGAASDSLTGQPGRNSRSIAVDARRSVAGGRDGKYERGKGRRSSSTIGIHNSARNIARASTSENSARLGRMSMCGVAPMSPGSSLGSSGMLSPNRRAARFSIKGRKLSLLRKGGKGSCKGCPVLQEESVRSEESLDERSRLKRKKREKQLFDGKLLAVEYLKGIRKKEADTVHALTTSLRAELRAVRKQNEDHALRLGSRLGTVEAALGPIQGALDTLLRLQTRPADEKTTDAVQRVTHEIEERAKQNAVFDRARIMGSDLKRVRENLVSKTETMLERIASPFGDSLGSISGGEVRSAEGSESTSTEIPLWMRPLSSLRV